MIRVSSLTVGGRNGDK